MSAAVHPDIAPLVSAGRIPAAIAPRLSALEPGVFVNHKSWGVGKIAAWELDDDRLLVDFEDRKGHAMKLEFAAKSLEPIPDTHILARRHADPASLQALAKSDRPALVRAVLESHGGSMLLDSFEAVVKPKIVSEGSFKSWWEGTKKELRSRPEFIVPSKRNLPLELRGGDLPPHEALIEDFRRARNLKLKARALDAISRELELFPDESVFESVLREADEAAAQNLRLRTVEALDLILSRDELRDKVRALHDKTTPALGRAIEQEGTRLAESVGSLPVSRQRRVFDALVDATGHDGLPQLLPLVNRLSLRSLNELAAVLHEKGHISPLNSFLRTGIVHRTLSSDALVWVARERTSMTMDVFGMELSKALLSAIERDHFDEANRKSNRVTDLLMDDRELIADFITGVELAQARNFARQMMISPGIDEMGKRSMLARFIKVYPELEDLINERSGDKHEETTYIVSWRSLEAKKKEYDHLVNVEIPKNREDISIARSYGDLRENFEFKSAKEYSRVLQRRRFEMERDLHRARGTDFSDATGDVVSVGTRVEIRETVSGNAEVYTILGAWDTNVADHIISYLSATASALLGHAPGDEVEIPAEDSPKPRRIAIVKIEKADVSDYGQSDPSLTATPTPDPTAESDPHPEGESA